MRTSVGAPLGRWRAAGLIEQRDHAVDAFPDVTGCRFDGDRADAGESDRSERPERGDRGAHRRHIPPVERRVQHRQVLPHLHPARGREVPRRHIPEHV